MWEPAVVLKRRVPRVLTTGFLLALAVSGVSGCRTSPNVAAYVGDEQVTVAELDAAAAAGLRDPHIAAFAKRDEAAYTRQVLSLLVQKEIYAAAADRYDVHVTDQEVQARFEEILGKDDPDAVFAQLADRGLTRADVFQNVRQLLVRQEVAESGGKADALTDDALRARYDDVRQSLTEYSFGYISTPDAATAQAVLGQLTADPASYAAVAAQHPDPITTPLETRGVDGLPDALAQGITSAAPNTGFTLPGPDPGQVVVIFVAGTVVPSFEEVRPRLQQAAEDDVAKAGATLVDDLRKDLGVTVNPRFGELKKGQLVAHEGGVVDILDGDATGAGAPDNPGG
jgi:peptidyl-prolyl cis-trans isomerase SurA